MENKTTWRAIVDTDIRSCQEWFHPMDYQLYSEDVAENSPVDGILTFHIRSNESDDLCLTGDLTAFFDEDVDVDNSAPDDDSSRVIYFDYDFAKGTDVGVIYSRHELRT